jgi:predicted GIY-YIG superfamily endonuclease
MAKIIAVYCITSPTARVFYVGSTEHLDRRVRAHLSKLGRGVHHSKKLQAAWDEHHDVCLTNYVECSTIEEAQSLELHLLGLFHGSELTCNVTTSLRGAAKGFKFSEETKEKMSSRMKGQGNPMHGRKHSEETRAKMREAYKPVVDLSAFVARVSKAVEIDGIKYTSVTDASRATGIDRANIRKRIASDNPRHSGYRWVLESNDSEN